VIRCTRLTEIEAGANLLFGVASFLAGTAALNRRSRPTSQNARQNCCYKELLGTAGLVIFRSGDFDHMRTGSDVGQISIARTSARDVI
jgi:hypothetical protein